MADIGQDVEKIQPLETVVIQYCFATRIKSFAHGKNQFFFFTLHFRLQFFRTKVYLNGVNDNHVVTRESKRKMFHDSVVRQI